MLLRRSYGLDTLELKALSVPSSLRFLLGVEYDVVLCVTEVGARRPFALHFPPFADTFRKLLSLCAKRFSLHCQHNSDGSVLSGVVVMPLLRYADYLPCALHVEELLTALQVAPVTKTMRRVGTAPTTAASSVAPAGSASFGSSCSAATSHTATGGSLSIGANEFNACFLDYSEFSSDASLTDVHGLGFYLMHDYGLSLATHGHLLLLRLHHACSVDAALREFQRFSGWSKFDLRFFDEQDKAQGGVIVMPTVQDACDLLERYEDEDSDDEGELLPFVLRPVLPLVPVPAIEDSALRRMRQEHWPEIERFWERFPTTRNTVVLYGLHDGATLQDVRAILHGLPITSCKLVEDDSPMHRRRAFITFASAAGARKALELDGKSTRGRTLRVQVAPPYISETRWGREVPTPPRPSASSTPAMGATAKAMTPAPKSVPKPRSQAGNSAPATADVTHAGTSPAMHATRPTTAGAPPVTRLGSHGGGPMPHNGENGVATREVRVTGELHATSLSSSSQPVASAAAAVVHSDCNSHDAMLSRSPEHLSATRTARVVSPPLTAMPANQRTGKNAASAVVAAALVAAATSAVSHHPGAALTTLADGSNSSSVGGSTAVQNSKSHAADKAMRGDTVAPPAATLHTASTSPASSYMNAEAKEFVPHFVLHADSPEFRPADLQGNGTGGGGFTVVEGLDADELGLPPPPPPPPYISAVGTPFGMGFNSPPLSAPVSVSLTHDYAPPDIIPPPYGLPPPYRGTSAGTSAAASKRTSVDRVYEGSHMASAQPLPPPPPPPPPPYTRSTRI